MVLNIGQFLKKDTTGHGWSVQQWLEAYTHALQCIGEAVESRCWRPEGKGFAPKVSLLVEAFIGVTGVQVTTNCHELLEQPPGDVLHQRDEGTHANIISYLDELAMCPPSGKAWDELVWPPASSAPHMPCQSEHVGYIQGCIVELVLTMAPFRFCMSNPGGSFICFTRGLIFEGNVLAYDPSTNKVEWIPMHGTTGDLLWAEEVSALALCNMVPHVLDEGAERLD